MAKVRITLEFDVSKETVWSEERELDGNLMKVPVTAETALRWYQHAFDMHCDNYAPGFLLDMKAEFIEGEVKVPTLSDTIRKIPFSST